MKFLTIFLIILTIAALIFWLVDGPGSGMNYTTVGLAVGTVVLLLANKKHTGSFLSDDAMGH